MLDCVLLWCQVQHAIQEADPAVGAELVQLLWDHRELDDGAEPVGVSGGCVCGRRHRQAAAAGEPYAVNMQQTEPTQHGWLYFILCRNYNYIEARNIVLCTFSLYDI